MLTEPLVNNKQSDHTLLEVIPHSDKVPEGDVPGFEFNPGLMEITVINNNTSPNLIGKGNFWTIGVIQSTSPELELERVLDNNQVVLLTAEEDLVYVELDERDGEDPDSGGTVFGLWLDVTFQNTRTQESDTFGCLLAPYSQADQAVALN